MSVISQCVACSGSLLTFIYRNSCLFLLYLFEVKRLFNIFRVDSEMSCHNYVAMENRHLQLHVSDIKCKFFQYLICQIIEYPFCRLNDNVTFTLHQSLNLNAKFKL